VFRRLLLVLAACAALSACSGSHHASAPPPAKTDLPADHYDAVVYLCVRGPGSAGCGETASASATDAVRTDLTKDADVVEFLYLSQQDAYRIARVELPAATVRLIGPADLPAAFLVAFGHDKGAGLTALKSRFAHAAGVQRVAACTSATKQCSVAELRKLRLVH
jgi:hypothetical protein